MQYIQTTTRLKLTNSDLLLFSLSYRFFCQSTVIRRKSKAFILLGLCVGLIQFVLSFLVYLSHGVALSATHFSSLHLVDLFKINY